jgi:hypothetical protein
MACLENSAFGDHTVRIQRRLPTVDPISDEGMGSAGWGPGMGQSKPEVPVSEVAKSVVETARLTEQVRADDDVRAARRHEVLVDKAVHKLLG